MITEFFNVRTGFRFIIIRRNDIDVKTGSSFKNNLSKLILDRNLINNFETLKILIIRNPRTLDPKPGRPSMKTVSVKIIHILAVEKFFRAPAIYLESNH